MPSSTPWVCGSALDGITHVLTRSLETASCQLPYSFLLTIQPASVAQLLPAFLASRSFSTALTNSTLLLGMDGDTTSDAQSPLHSPPAAHTPPASGTLRAYLRWTVSATPPRKCASSLNKDNSHAQPPLHRRVLMSSGDHSSPPDTGCSPCHSASTRMATALL